MSVRGITGVLLAAGRGTRMGRTKQTVPVWTAGKQQPLVAVAFDAIAACCDQMIVVVGHAQREVVAALGNRRYSAVTSPPGAEMAESIRAGLRAISTSGESDFPSIFLQPGDHPRVAQATLEQLLAAARRRPTQVIIPRFEGTGGHPILIPGDIAKMLMDEPLPGGLRTFWRANPQHCHHVAVNDPGVTTDLDTPDDVRQLETDTEDNNSMSAATR